MLKIAVPNKGSLSETAAHMLREAGYEGRRDHNDLIFSDVRNDVEFFYLRPRDIATYVGSGALDVGITGRDLLLDSKSAAIELAPLNFGESTFHFAAAPGAYSSLDALAGARVATSYPNLVRTFLKKFGMSVEVIRLDGAVECAVRLGVADAVADVVSTGATLRAAGLKTFGPMIVKSAAVLIGAPEQKTGTTTLIRRLNGVLVARQYALVDYDLPSALLEHAVEVAPGLESPTISPLRDPEWVAVRVMVPRVDINDVMDRLYAVGARAILVSAIHAARL